MTDNIGALYKVLADGHRPASSTACGLSNTLAWSSDGRLFYYGDTLSNVISVFDFDPATGRISGQRPLSDAPVPGACDGSAIDEEGFLWKPASAAAPSSASRPTGRVDRVIETPVANPTSCCFGGPDLATLYVTSARFP